MMNNLFPKVTDNISVYIHLPWCIQKCPYCDFNSHSLKQNLPEEVYVNQLIKDLAHDANLVKNRKLISVFFGGGTPSLFSGEAIAHIIQEIFQYIPKHDEVEITLEANPGTIDAKHFEAYLKAGVNRLSLGMQSFDNDMLKRLGRIHDNKAAINAFSLARKLGFTNINLDLMFGLPEQSLVQGLQDLHQAIQLAPEHISWYQLTLEPNTAFYRQPPSLPSHDAVFELYQQGQVLLKAAGYESYEVSAYAKPGKTCQHNLNYWRFGDYLGIGAGAHGKITMLQPWQVIRTRKHSHPKQYLSEKLAIVEQRVVSSTDIIFEYFLNHLRLSVPVNFEHFEAYTKQPRRELLSFANEAHTQGFVEIDDTHLILTKSGQMFLDDVLALFLPKASP